MGIVCGLPLGTLLHAFVMSQINVDMVAFQNVVRPVSYLLTVLIVILFTVITDLIMRRKIAKIDMAESLKSIE
jgi:putative ABC transport system permease protein